MQKIYPVSPAHKQLLRFTPTAEQCLQCRDLYTVANLSNTLVFLLPLNGNGYWYHIEYVQKNTLFGHVLNGDFWRYSPVELKQLYRYY